MNKNEVTRIIDAVKNISDLSITQEEVLDSLLILFAENKTKEIKQVEKLLNNEIEYLLETLPQRKVIDFVTDNFDFIAPNDESGLVDALEDLSYDFMRHMDVEEMIIKIEECGYYVSDYENKTIDPDSLDLIDNNKLEEIIELYNKSNWSERESIFNKLFKIK